MSDNFMRIRKGLIVNPTTNLPTTSVDGAIVFDDNEKKFKRWSSSANSWIPLGEGSGELNFLQLSNKAFDAESGTTGWSTYKDTAAARPEDGTGGTPSVVSTISTTTTNPLSGTRSFLLTKGSGDAQGEGWSVDFQIDRAHFARVLQIEFDYQVESGTFVAGSTVDYTTAGDSDLIVYIYDIDNNQLIEPTTFRLYSNASNIADKFIGNFQTSANGVNYRLIFHVARTSTAAWTLKVDNIVVKIARYTYGTPITDWVDFPSVAAGTLITAAHNTSPVNPTYGTVVYNRAQWRRVGGEMEIRWVYKQQGSPAGTAGNGMYLFNLPPGYQIDVNRLSPAMPNTGTAAMDFGYIPNSLFVALDIGSPTHGIGAASMYSTTQLKMYFQAAGPGGSGVNYWHSGYFPFSIANNIFSLFASVPIVGWSSSVKISEPMELRDVYVRVGKTGTQTVSTSPTIITYDQKYNDTTNSFNLTTSQFTAPISGYYFINMYIDIDGVNLSFLSFFVNSISVKDFSIVDVGHASDVIYLRAGDILDVRANAISGTRTLGPYPASFPAILTIHRLSSPQALAQSEAVACSYYNTAGVTPGSSYATRTIARFTTVRVDTHAIYNPTTGIGVIPVSGIYEIRAQLLLQRTSGAVGDIHSIILEINNTPIAEGLQIAATTGANGVVPTVSWTGRLNAGDTFRIATYVQGTSPSNPLNTDLNLLSVKKIE